MGCAAILAPKIRRPWRIAGKHACTSRVEPLGRGGRDIGCPSGVGEVDARASIADAMKPRGGERFVRREDPIGARAASPIGHSDLLEDRRR